MFLSFFKWQGAGNDFVLIDDRDEVFPVTDRALIEKLCHRQYGIGADGLLLVQKSDKAAVKMRYFNADGREVAMCGNGLRCVFRYSFEKGYCSPSDSVETQKAIYQCTIKGNEVAVNMGVPKLFLHDKEVYEGRKASFLEVGVPHLVIFDEAIDKIDVNSIGRDIRYSPAFALNGVNVNFVERLSKNKIALRTYERGVEAETLACGTGAIASAFIAYKNLAMPQEMEVITRSQVVLSVAINEHDECMLCGPSKLVFNGSLNTVTF